MKFTDENKAVKDFGDSNYFGFGVHKVQIMQFENGGTEEGEKEYIEVTVCDPTDGEKVDTARVWFTTDKAANYSFNTLRQIAVHNALEASKDLARDAVDAVASTDELVALLNDKLIGKECWFTKYYDPSRSYINAQGDTKKSVNKNIYGYEPKLREDLMPGKADAAGTPLGGVDITASAEEAGILIPKDDDWAK